MATIDEILGGSRRGDGGAPKGTREWHEQQQGGGSQPATPPAKGTQEWSEQNSGDNAPVANSSIAKGGGNAEKPSSSQGNQAATGGGGGGYEEIFRKLYPESERPMTAAEVEKERKKHKRDRLFAAIGDGVSALSNLFFTTQYAPNMYTGKKTMSEHEQIRYDKLMKDNDAKRNAFLSRLIRARQADDDADRRERSWQRQLGLDQEARERYEEEARHKKERERLADERYEAEQKESKRRWQATFDEQKRRADRSYNWNVSRQGGGDTQGSGSSGQGVDAGVSKGRMLGFADGDGNRVAIHEDVWKGSMPSVYDVLVSEGVGKPDGLKESSYKRSMEKKTPSEKDAFVKENWHKSSKARGLMMRLSELDPATMKSEVDEDVEEYIPGGEDEVIDYVPGNNK